MRTRVQGWMLSWMVVLVGCAHGPAQRVEAPPAKPRVKLVVLPVDPDQFPQIAASLNKALHDVKVKGIDDYFLSKVTLEVVQLSIECVQPTSECYTAVGKSLSANRLLLGHVLAVGKRKRDKSVRVTITLYDVDAGAAVNVVDRVYRTPELASRGVPDLVTEASGEAAPSSWPDDLKPASPAKGRAVSRGGRL